MAYLREIELRYKTTAIESDAVGRPVSSSGAVAELFSDLQNETKEKFIVVNLDTKNKILCFEVVAIGSVSTIYMRPMEVFRTSILVNATSAIVMHNHPSGDCEPSQSDIEFTKKLCRISKDLGLTLWDHLIIGVGEYYSFADNGLMSGIVQEVGAT